MMMQPSAGKSSCLRNILVRVLFCCVIVICVRFAYVVTVTGESCDIGDFCFFSLPEKLNAVAGFGQLGLSPSSVVAVDHVAPKGPAWKGIWATEGFQRAVRFYSSVFQDLIAAGYLSQEFKTLCVDTPLGQDVFALKEIGVADSVGIFKKATKPLVVSGQAIRQPFDDNAFDFIFSGNGTLDRSVRQADFAIEISRTLRPEGHFVVHIAPFKDTYSFNSFLDLFNCCRLVGSRDIEGFESSMPKIREIVMIKDSDILGRRTVKPGGHSVNKCSVPEFKQELIRNSEPLIAEEPLKPWITLKKNLKNIKYLTTMVDISFKPRYVYIDVGARSYGSSIVSWFKKQYPKQNKTFEIYAIEADKTFHDQYKSKKGVKLLPFAAWVRNESLFFEINQDPGDKDVEKGRGMGRIRPAGSAGSSASISDVDEIHGFDFAEWLKNTVTEKDFVVMKMDVEGTEFDLIPRLFETGAICLIDEIYLECHYNRWQKCCPGERSSKYERTYGQCLELFASLRESGVLVHQWW